jgi:hypothetical protein
VQEKFVEHLVTVVADPDDFVHQAKAMVHLSVETAKETERLVLNPGMAGSPVGKQHVPKHPEVGAFTGAVLGAYLSSPFVHK